MAKDKSRVQRIFDFRRRGMKPGFCHCCGLYVTELTDEHAPPKRTQFLIPPGMLVRNSTTKVKAHNLSKRNLPPAIFAPGGFKFKTFCIPCQGKTQRLYGNAFFDWTQQGLDFSRSVTEFDACRITSAVTIQPLNVIKQMASNALAVSGYRGVGHNSAAGEHHGQLKKRLRSFVQNPSEKKVPRGFRFLLFLSPVRPEYELPQCRYEVDARLIDIVRRINTDLMAEIAVPPFGVLVFFENGERMHPDLRPLMDITHFADFELDERVTIDLDVPVRTVFGPSPLRFWQDARLEDSFETIKS